MARGSITKRQTTTPGRFVYQVRVELPPDPKTGKRRQGAETFRTRDAAQKRLTAWLLEVDRGTVVLPARTTVGELLPIWLGSLDLKPTSRQSYEDIINRYLIPSLGSIRVQKLVPVQVQGFMDDLRSAGKGTRTIQMCHMRLSQALDWAMRMELVSRNVCKVVPRPATEKRDPTIWSPEEAQRFLAAAGDWRPFFEFILATGVRRGEAIGLKWSDVDPKAGTIRVQRTVSALVGQGLVITNAKTESSRRTIRLGSDAIDLLRRQRVISAERRMLLGAAWEGPDDTNEWWIFPNDFGGLLYPSNVQRAFSRILRESGVSKIRIHDLRHSHATWLLLAKEPVQVVSERLGHKKPSITWDLYAHTLANSQESAADITDRLLRERREVLK